MKEKSADLQFILQNMLENVNPSHFHGGSLKVGGLVQHSKNLISVNHHIDKVKKQ